MIFDEGCDVGGDGDGALVLALMVLLNDGSDDD